jgi:hypothetical protein
MPPKKIITTAITAKIHAAIFIKVFLVNKFCIKIIINSGRSLINFNISLTWFNSGILYNCRSSAKLKIEI